MEVRTFKAMVDAGMKEKGFVPDADSLACVTVNGDFVGKYINNEKPKTQPAFLTASARELKMNDSAEMAISLAEYRIKNSITAWENNARDDGLL